MKGLPVLCVTNRNLCKKDFLSQIEGIAQGRPQGILLREKDLSEQEYRQLAAQCLTICRRYHVDLIIPSYPRVARELSVSKIHLPLERFLQERDLLEGFQQIGVSIHSPEEARQAQRMGAGYLIAGHIYPTGCKPGLPPRGLDFLQKVVDSVSIPVYAIGGITPARAMEVAKMGAQGICVMSQLMTSSCPQELLKAYASW